MARTGGCKGRSWAGFVGLELQQGGPTPPKVCAHAFITVCQLTCLVCLLGFGRSPPLLFSSSAPPLLRAGRQASSDRGREIRRPPSLAERRVGFVRVFFLIASAERLRLRPPSAVPRFVPPPPPPRSPFVSLVLDSNLLV